MALDGWPHAPCQFWNTWAWQSMIMGRGRARLLRHTEYFHVMVEQTLHFSIDHQKRRIEIEEMLPLHIAISHGPGIGALVDRVARTEHMSPVTVALDEQQYVAVAAHPHVGLLGPNRFSAEYDLARRRDEFRFRKQDWNAGLLAAASSDRECDVGIVEIVERLETTRVLLSHHQ